METNKEGFYDIEYNLEQILTDSGAVSEWLYLKNLRERKLYLNDSISTMSVGDIVPHILQYNKDDTGIPPEDRKPILLYVTSDGGDVDAGFELIDAIRTSITPVWTVNLGYQYSMGFLIGLAGHTRYAMPNAKYLMHDGSSFVYNSGAKVQDQMEFQRRVEDRIKKYIISRSKLTSKEYDSKLRVEWYLFADEAKEKGFVDYIIGEDCDLEQVI